MTPRTYHLSDKYNFFGKEGRRHFRFTVNLNKYKRYLNYKNSRGSNIPYKIDLDFSDFEYNTTRVYISESSHAVNRKNIGILSRDDDRKFYHRVNLVDHLERKKGHLMETTKKVYVDTNFTNTGFHLANATLDSGFNCITHEYYLLDINRRYPFSLTVNELLTIDRASIEGLIKEIEKVLKQPKYSKVCGKLRKLELIDYTMYENDFVCFAFPKATILTNNKYKKSVYAIELIANSVYPKDKVSTELICNISNVIYKTLLDLGLDTNARLVPDEEVPPVKDFVINKIVREGTEYRSLSMNIKNSKLGELQKIYYPFLDTDLLFKEYSISDDKLLILHGENGSGKTKLSTMLFHMFANKEYSCYSIPGTIIDDPSLWSYIDLVISDHDDKKEGLIFVIDDIDPIYLNRDTKDGHTENKFFNNLLIMLDGNVDIPIKLIITSNYHIREELDEPLYRTGRLFDMINIRYLTQEEATKVLEYNKMSKKDIKDFFKTHAALDWHYKQSDIAQFIKEKQRNITRSYIIDKSIASNTFRVKSKIGF